MSVAEEIKKAIGAHGMWKQRLRTAIDTGSSEFAVTKVQVDNACDFGKWLYSLQGAERTSVHWGKVQGLHAQFHKEAARVLGLALGGKKDEASKAIEANSQYATISAQLTSAMMEWTKTAG